MAEYTLTQNDFTQHDLEFEIKLTSTVHKGPYPSISPLRPEASQAGNVVLIGGASSGIGYAIARAFGQASASRIILLGRQTEALEAAKTNLCHELKDRSPNVLIDARTCNVASLDDTEALWEDLKNKGINVNVLVLNAASVGAQKPILETGLEEVWSVYLTNVRSILDLTKRFYDQDMDKSKPKYLINVSTSAIHRWLNHAPDHPTYGLTKNAGTLALQQIAKDTQPEYLQVVSFHPGAILTNAARSAGFDESTMPWDHEDLPGQFAVWAATPEAAFLHGRFVWARWDVDELKHGELRKRIDEDPYFLKIGVIGAAAN